jgi:hypothetical protein
MKHFFTEHYFLTIIIVVSIIIAVILGRWIYNDCKKFETNCLNRILLVLQSLNFVFHLCNSRF